MCSLPQSKGIFSCKADVGYTGPDGGPFEPCPVGSYKDSTGSAGKCQACPELSSTLSSASGSALDCKAEPGAEGPDGGPFRQCPVGTWSDKMGMVKCIPCPPGGTTLSPGKHKYEDCIALPGWTNEKDWSQGPFKKCAVGSYKSLYGPYPCKLCPFCSTTEEEGATKIKLCVADIGCEGKGFGWELGFTKCKHGFFKKTVGNGDCPPCQPGQKDAACGGVFTEADTKEVAAKKS